MKRYRNIAGNSGVFAYEMGPDHIIVQFLDGQVYLYSYKSAGKYAVEKMKFLAEKGKGLSTFISVHVRERFEKRLK